MPLSEAELNFLHTMIEGQTDLSSKTGWHNYPKNVKCPQSLVIDIKTIRALQSVMKVIYAWNLNKSLQDRITIRVAAGGRDTSYSHSYSFTPCVAADVILRLEGKEFREVSVVDDSQYIMRIGGSAQIGETDQCLYETYRMVLPTSSLIPYVTIAGLLANAGHGTGIDQPAFAGLVKAMTLCLPNGVIVRIDSDHPHFNTIRAAHLGMFGVVINVELQCMPAMKLECVMEKRSLPEFLAEVSRGLFRHDEYVSVMYVPTYADDLNNNNIKNVIIYRYRPVEMTVNNVNEESKIDRFIQSLEIAIQDKFNIDDLLVSEQSLIPAYMQYLVTRSTIGKKDQLSVEPWWRWHNQRAFPTSMNDMGFLFPVRDVHNEAEIIEAYVKLAKTLDEYAKKGVYPVAYANYGRYFSGTSGGLSTSTCQPGEHVFGFDIVSLPGLKGFDQFRQEMTDYFINERSAKPHWGKYLAKGLDYAKLYGENWESFVKAINAWHEEHGLSFDKSPFLNQMMCDVLGVPELTPRTIPHLVSADSEDELSPALPIAALANAANLLITEDDPEAQALKAQLEEVKKKHRRTDSSSSLFKPNQSSAEEDKKVKKEKSHCCRLM